MTTPQWTRISDTLHTAEIDGVRILTDGQGNYRPADIQGVPWHHDLAQTVDLTKRLLAAFDVQSRYKRGRK
jgi:hypothetical protein